MVIYAVIIGITLVVTFLLNLLVAMPIFDLTLLQVLIRTGLSVIVVFAIDAVLAFLIRRLPNKWFNFRFKLFRVFKFEKKYYEKIQIKKWKDKIPELGQFTNFSKSKVEDPTNNEYIERFLLEICYGEVIHFTSIFFGFLIIFMYDLRYCLYMGIPVAIANGIINYLSFAILRYNRPKLMTIHERNRRLEERKKAKQVNDNNN